MPDFVCSAIRVVSILALSLAVAVFAGSARAVAQDTSEVESRALDLARAALEHYQEGRLEDAVELLIEARTLHPGEPLLVYNLARAYEGLGRLAEARDAYRRYLDQAPEAPERGAVEVRIASIDESLADRARLAAEERRAREDAASARRAARAFDPVPWVVAAIGAGTLAAGVVVAAFAVEGREHALRTDVHRERVARFADAQGLSDAANVLFAVGGTIALTGLVWGLVQVLSSSGGGDAPLVAASHDGLTLGARW